MRFRLTKSVLTAAAIVSIAGAALSSVTGACTATVALNTALITDGVTINSTLLLGQGLGCGTSDDQVFKYVALVIGSNKNVIAAGVFDCFADGVFANLPGTDAGEVSFAVWVYLYNQADFEAANADGGTLTAAVGQLNTLIQPDASVTPLPARSVSDGGLEKTGLIKDLSVVCRSKATWVSVCQATSQAGVQVLASCSALDGGVYSYPALENSTPTSCALPLYFAEAGLHD